MTAKGLEVIDHTVHLTHEWINELCERLDWSSHKDALRLLRITMRTFRDYLSHDEIAQFTAQLPLLIRGMFYEGWNPSHAKGKDRHLDAFLAEIDAEVSNVTEYRGSEDIRTVLRFLNARLSNGEIEDVRASLPEAIREFWPSTKIGS